MLVLLQAKRRRFWRVFVATARVIALLVTCYAPFSPSLLVPLFHIYICYMFGLQFALIKAISFSFVWTLHDSIYFGIRRNSPELGNQFVNSTNFCGGAKIVVQNRTIDHEEIRLKV